MLGMQPRRLLVPALVLFCSAAACKKNPAEQTAAAQTPAGAAQQPAEPPPPPKPMPAELPEVMARVNGQPVTKGEFDRLVKNIEAGRGPIPAEKRDEVLRAVLDQLITYNVLKQEAESRKLVVAEADVEAQFAQMQKQFPSEAEFNKALVARNTTAAQFKADARTRIAINKMMEAEVASLAATDADAQDFYTKNPDKFVEGETARASHILVKAEENADEATKKAARAKIDGLLKRVKAGEDFAALAKQNSDDPGSGMQGGDLGFFPRKKMVPAFDEAAFTLKPGEISDVITTQFGYHIIKLVEKKEASTRPLDQVKPQVLEYLTNQKKQERVEAMIEEAKKRAKIEVLV